MKRGHRPLDIFISGLQILVGIILMRCPPYSNVLPFPGPSLSTQTSPPWISTIRLTRAFSERSVDPAESGDAGFKKISHSKLVVNYTTFFVDMLLIYRVY